MDERVTRLWADALGTVEIATSNGSMNLGRALPRRLHRSVGTAVGAARPNLSDRRESKPWVSTLQSGSSAERAVRLAAHDIPCEGERSISIIEITAVLAT
jgi:hypothetical protein